MTLVTNCERLNGHAGFSCGKCRQREEWLSPPVFHLAQRVLGPAQWVEWWVRRLWVGKRGKKPEIKKKTTCRRLPSQVPLAPPPRARFDRLGRDQETRDQHSARKQGQSRREQSRPPPLSGKKMGDVSSLTSPRRMAVSTSQPSAQHRALSGVHAAALTGPRLRPLRRRGARLQGRAQTLAPQAAAYSVPNLETRTLFKRRFRVRAAAAWGPGCSRSEATSASEAN